MQRMKTVFDVVVSIIMVSAAAILVRDGRATTNPTRPSSVMFDAMFAEGASLDEPGVRSIASRLGIDQKQFQNCLSERQTKDRVDSDVALAQALGVKGTPVFLFGNRLADGRIQIRRTLAGTRRLSDFTAILNSLDSAVGARTH